MALSQRYVLVGAPLGAAGLGSAQIYPIDRSMPGSTPSTDANGNSATGAQVVNVRYAFEGFLPPVENGKVYKSGRTIPVKIRVSLADGSVATDLLATIQVLYLVDGAPQGEPLDVESTGDADTKSMPPGTYRVIADLHDGSVPPFIDISLK